MKLFLITKKRLYLYSLLALCACTLLWFGTTDSVSVFNPGQEVERLLPIYNVNRGEEKLCALTFDAAWDDEDTDKLIEILEKYDAKATFFMVGSWVEKFPDSVKKFADKGHEIMNHSDSHPHIDQLSEEKIREEITKCDDKIETVTGHRPTLFRGPYGEYNNTVIRVAEETGHRVLQWDVDSLDWKDLEPNDIVTRVLKRTKPGSVLLFHNGAKNTPLALPLILEKLKADGYRFVTASGLLLPEPSTIDSKGTQQPASPGPEHTEETEEAA